jgi:hypothetical protein
MNMPGEMTIEFSTKKWLLILVGSILFVVGGFWMLNEDEETIRMARHWDPASVHVVGGISVIFGGLGAVIAMWGLFRKKAALKFTEAGLIDNSTSVSAGLIPWSDIVGAEIYEVQRKPMLVIKVTDPDRYIETGSDLKRWAKRANFNMCGSPVVISCSTLKIDFDELVQIFNAYISKYGTNT